MLVCANIGDVNFYHLVKIMSARFQLWGDNEILYRSTGYGPQGQKELDTTEAAAAFFEHFLTFGHKMLQTHLVLPLSQPWNQSFSQSFGSLVIFNRECYIEIKISH